MKKRIAAVLLAGIVLGMFGCGKTQESESAGQEKADKEETAEISEKSEDETEIPGGIYVNGGELVSVPMGTCYKGEVKTFCRILMPEKYVFGAIYTDENGEEHSNYDAANYLENEEDIDSQPVSSWIDSRSPYEDGTVVMAMLVTSEVQSLDEILEYASNEVFLDEKTFYFVDEDSYATADMNLCRIINEGIVLSISYEGPMAEKLGIEQLAESLNNLIEITN